MFGARLDASSVSPVSCSGDFFSVSPEVDEGRRKLTSDFGSGRIANKPDPFYLYGG